MKCIVCDREALEKYCEFHEIAYRNVVQKFEDWKRATGVSWKEYLKELVENAYRIMGKRSCREFIEEHGWMNYVEVV